jgi:hypothetical protein
MSKYACALLSATIILYAALIVFSFIGVGRSIVLMLTVVATVCCIAFLLSLQLDYVSRLIEGIYENNKKVEPNPEQLKKLARSLLER